MFMRAAVFVPAFVPRRRSEREPDREEWGRDARNTVPSSPRQVHATFQNSTEKSPTGTDQQMEEEEGGEGNNEVDGLSEYAVGSVAPGGGGQSDGDGDGIYKVRHRYLPIVSGLACPFSVLLDIPGLTERWYIKTEGYDVIETQPNPGILDAALVVSIVFGLLANAALITRFLERRPRVATLVAIFALTLHDIINVVTVVLFGVVHRFNDGFTYGTAYWMCVASTVASLICNITLIIDFSTTKDFVRNGSGLTEKQRSLVIAVMALLCYIGLGSLVFSFLIGLTYINSLYFTICTITSVGFGDIYPISLASRLFSFFYDTIGLVLIAFTIALARETVIETFEASYRRRRESLAVKARARKEEKKRLLKERRERRQRELQDARDHPEMFRTNTMLSIGGGRNGAFAARLQRDLDYQTETNEGITAGKAWVNRVLRKWGWKKPYKSREEKEKESSGFAITRTLTQQSLIGDDSYKSFRKEIQKEQQREFRLKIGIAGALFWSFWLIGSAVFHFTEKWTYFESMWFCFVFFTTIGYGDYSPKSSAGRAFFVAWSILGIATMTLLLSVVTETWSSRYKSSITQSKVQRSIRRVRNRSEQEGSSSAMAQLLALEGYEEEDSIEPKDLPGKLAEAVRGFHEHAKFFMHGRTGDTPPRLRSLIDAGDEIEEELDKLRENGDFTETGGGETRHFLFMVSYERTFDILLDAAENLSEVFKAHTGELETMRRLNEELRTAVDEAKAAAIVTTDPFPFPSHRPPGGDGDDEVEERLIAEIDDDDLTKSQPQSGATTPVSGGSGTPNRPRMSSVTDTLKNTTSFIRKLQSTRSTRLSLTRHNSIESLPGNPALSIDTTMVGSSPLAPSPSTGSNVVCESPLGLGSAISRQGSITFIEPIGRSRSGSNMGIISEATNTTDSNKVEMLAGKSGIVYEEPKMF